METINTDSRTLLHTVARLHYEQDMSQRDIAKQMELSTATVSRLIRRARDEGIVRIEISEFIEPDSLAEQLAASLNLKQVAIAPTAPEPGAMAALAEPVARLLRNAPLGPGSVLGLGWGRTVWEVLQVGLPTFPGTTTVPLSGGIPEAARHFQIGEFARLAASQIGGNPRFVHAPYLLSDEARHALIKDPAISGSVNLWDRIDVAMVGIGRPHGGDRTSGGKRPHGALAESRQAACHQHRAVEARAVSDWIGSFATQSGEHSWSSPQRTHKRFGNRHAHGDARFRCYLRKMLANAAVCELTGTDITAVSRNVRLPVMPK